jgi:hypothetical protein
MRRGHFLRSCRTPRSAGCQTKWGDSGGRRRSMLLVQRIFPLMLIGGACIFFSAPCMSQEESQGKETSDSSETANQTEQSTTPAQPETQPEKEAKPAPRGAFVAVPVPILSPAIGTGIVPVVGYIFPFSTKDKISSPSVVGGGGLITNNGSRAFVSAGQLYLKENRYRITAAYARGNLNYDAYGSGIFEEHKLPLKQTGQILFGEFLRRAARGSMEATLAPLVSFAARNSAKLLWQGDDVL